MTNRQQRELILGGQKSGKSRCAERRAQAWLAQRGAEALLIATAIGGDDEMRERIERHQRDRQQRCPGLVTLEAHADLPDVLRAHAAPNRLLVVDCLTLWLTQLMFPIQAKPTANLGVESAIDELLGAARDAPGAWVMVSNEIGFGVIPPSRESRLFVDRLGLLHQALGELADRITLLVAGNECAIKRP